MGGSKWLLAITEPSITIVREVPRRAASHGAVWAQVVFDTRFALKSIPSQVLESNNKSASASAGKDMRLVHSIASEYISQALALVVGFGSVQVIMLIARAANP